MNSHANPNRVALVTGASSGMGKVIAARSLQDGFKVIADARRIDKMGDLKNLGAEIVGLHIAKEESIAAALGEIEWKFGCVDVLVNGCCPI